MVAQDKMTDILFDVHVADGMLSMMPVDSARMEIQALYDAIFERHGIDSTVLRTNLEFYATKPQVMTTIYTQLETRMDAAVNAEQDGINEHYRLERLADSIRTARITDSVQRVERRRLDAERMRHILFLPSADTSIDASVPVNPETLRQQLFEEVRFGERYVNALKGDKTERADSMVSDSTRTEPVPVGEVIAPRPAPETSQPSSPATRLMRSPEEVR